MNLRDLVFEALENAKTNEDWASGLMMSEWSDQNIADDLYDCVYWEGLEPTVDEIAAHVIAWRAAQVTNPEVTESGARDV